MDDIHKYIKVKKQDLNFALEIAFNYIREGMKQHNQHDGDYHELDKIQSKKNSIIQN